MRYADLQLVETSNNSACTALSLLPVPAGCGRPLVLCIDDDVQGLAIRRSVLQAQGYDVLTADNGPTGLWILQQATADAVVLDYAMPCMDGAAVAVEIRKHWPKIPIIALSGHDITQLPSNFLILIDRFLQKPSAPAELLSLLREVTDSRWQPK